MLNVALKEWSIVCDLLLGGELSLLLRKGGIEEDEGPGRFRLRHPRFALFPSWAHQKPGMIEPRYRQRVEVLDEPDELMLRGYAESVGIRAAPSRAALDSLDDLHCWTDEYVDMRWNYRPENPLYVVALRAYRLAEPKTVPNRVAYGGCRSWVPLEDEDAIDDNEGTPVLDAGAHDARMAEIGRRLIG